MSKEEIIVTHKNGYVGKLVGENEMYIYDAEGVEVLKTLFRPAYINSEESLRKFIDKVPLLVEAKNKNIF